MSDNFYDKVAKKFGDYHTVYYRNTAECPNGDPEKVFKVLKEGENMKKKNIKLQNQEKRIEKALERREFVSVSNLNKTKKLFQEAAKNYRELTRTKRITIRVNNEDLIKVKAKAKRSNVPYQTLLNALIRQFAEGRTSVQF